ncbi:MAG: hypothetical protein P8L85_13185 [Rubripirellula sp.]|nr:hypothetical protein [Rubripirellula sp.]
MSDPAEEQDLPAGNSEASERNQLERSLGRIDDDVPYHSLALDVDQGDIWGKIDVVSRRVGEWFNPILVKEARQSLKSRQFVITFFLLLLASCLWTVLGVVLNAPDVYYIPTGDTMIYGYYWVLAVPLIGMVPLAAQRSLAAEIDDHTFEMLVITKLTAMRIVMGKLNSAMLQMLIYFAAVVPCLAFTYLLRGIDLLTIFTLITILFFTALLVTSASLMLATLTANRAGQTLAFVASIAVIIFAEIMCAAFILGEILRLGVKSEEMMFTALFILVGVSCIALFVKVAATRIAPVTENRSTGLRYLMFLQQLIWAGVIGFLMLWYEDRDVVNFGTMVLGGYWLMMGTFMLAESPELSPRVQRGLPSTFAGRALMTWLNPGPGTGFVYAVATGTAGIGVLALFGLLVANADTLTFGMIMIGYLAGYLGIVRLIAMPLCRRFGRSVWLPVGALATVLIFSLMLPTVITVVSTGAPGNVYTPIEAMNWAWTIAKGFDRRLPPTVAFSILATGGLIATLNLALLFREFDYRRIAVPQRVLDDSAAE